MSLPQSLHNDAPAPEKVPTGHSEDLDPPSHVEPARQAAQPVWLVVVPPVVFDPDAQVKHTFDPSVDHLSSSPQAVHTPDALYFPAAHLPPAPPPE